MTTHPMRPAVAIAWLLGLTLLLTRPAIADAILAATNWALTGTGGGWALGAAFVATIAYITRSRWRAA